MDPRDIAENTIYCFERFGEHVRGYDAFRLNGLLRVENYFLLRVLERERETYAYRRILEWKLKLGLFVVDSFLTREEFLNDSSDLINRLKFSIAKICEQRGTRLDLNIIHYNTLYVTHVHTPRYWNETRAFDLFSDE